MAEVTQVGAAQDALATALAARSALAKVAVSVGWPTGGPKSEQIIVWGDVPDWKQDWDTSGQSGPAAIDESFTLAVEVYVRKTAKGGVTHAAVRDRAIALVGEIQDQLRTDFKLGGTCTFASITGGAHDEGVGEGFRAIAIQVHIFCEAVLNVG